MSEIINKLNLASSIQEGNELLKGLKRSQLESIAKEMSIYIGKCNKEMLIEKILFSAVQSRINSETILGVNLNRQ